MKKKTGNMALVQQFRSCTSCGSADGLEITPMNQRDDIVFCQVCGGQYLLQSLEPLKLHPLNPGNGQSHWLVDSY